LSSKFKNIGIIGKYAATSVGESLHNLGKFLLDKGVTVYLDDATAKVWPDHTLNVATRDEMGQKCDLVIVVGGDGTFLGAARSLCEYDNVTLLGLNLGWLGFLTDISPDEMETRLSEILAGKYIEEDRFLLHVKVLRNGKLFAESDALNDVVVHKSDVARMIEIDIHVNETQITTLRSDGLIVSTPTGSTAYALSGGGPIMEPELNAVLLVPICPHTMSHRPVVIDGNSVVEVVIKGDQVSEAQMTCDGQYGIALTYGDRLIIRRKPQIIRLIHPHDHNHFHILRSKLGWG
jgi:NAD+ kinase